jgi:hypothetical protein
MENYDSSSEGGNEHDHYIRLPSESETESEGEAGLASDPELGPAFTDVFSRIEDVDTSILAHKLVLTCLRLDAETGVQDIQPPLPPPQLTTQVSENGVLSLGGSDDQLRSYLAQLEEYISSKRDVMNTLAGRLLSRGLWFEPHGEVGHMYFTMCSDDTPEAQQSLRQLEDANPVSEWSYVDTTSSSPASRPEE